MTLIAYKDGILCADTLRLAGGIRANGAVMKIARREDGSLFAASGIACVSQAWMRWFLDGEEGDPPFRDESTEASIIIVVPCGKYRLWTEGAPLPETLAPDRFAMGDPDYLCGLMDAGLSAVKALKQALRRHHYGCYPLVEIDHSGHAQFWASEDFPMTREEFESWGGVDISECGLREMGR